MTTPAQDLARNLKDPEFAKLYGAASAKSAFAIILVKARERRGLSQRQLTDKMRYLLSRVKQIESGEFNITLDECGALLAILGYRLVMSLAPLEPEAGEPE